MMTSVAPVTEEVESGLVCHPPTAGSRQQRCSTVLARPRRSYAVYGRGVRWSLQSQCHTAVEGAHAAREFASH